MKCPHQPPCPAADRTDREAARIVATHPEQGWNLLCNGVVTFDDTGELLPDGTVVAPHRALPIRSAATPIATTLRPRFRPAGRGRSPLWFRLRHLSTQSIDAPSISEPR